MAHGGTGEQILVVEDDLDIRELVVRALDAAGFSTTSAASGRDARARLAASRPSLVVLDLGLPDVDGLELLREVRARYDVPTIVLTARDSEADRVAGLDVGADDYVTKPFSPRELVSRVRAVLRRTAPPTTAAVGEGPLVHGSLAVDPARREVRLGGVPIELTRREFDLLLHFVRHPDQVFSKGDLLTAVWQSSPEWQDAETVTEHVRRVRRKIEDDPAEPRRIVTLRGVGYRFQGSDGPGQALPRT